MATISAIYNYTRTTVITQRVFEFGLFAISFNEVVKQYIVAPAIDSIVSRATKWWYFHTGERTLIVLWNLTYSLTFCSHAMGVRIATVMQTPLTRRVRSYSYLSTAHSLHSQRPAFFHSLCSQSLQATSLTRNTIAL